MIDYKISLVNLRLAIKLKQLGFVVYMPVQYNTKDENFYKFSLEEIALAQVVNPETEWIFIPNVYEAYTFIRNTYPEWDLCIFKSKISNTYKIDVDNLEDYLSEDCSNGYMLEDAPTYEEAWEVGLEKICDYILNKQNENISTT